MRLQVSRRALLSSALVSAPLLAVSEALADVIKKGVLGDGAPSLASAFSADRRTVTATRITAEGISTVTAESEALLNTNLLQFLNRKATAAAVYSAPAHHAVPSRTFTAAAPEFLFIINGGVMLITPRGSTLRGLGSVTLLEGGSIAEKAGPEGYTAIRVRLAGAA